MIIILNSDINKGRTKELEKKCKEAGQETVRVDTEDYPGGPQISFDNSTVTVGDTSYDLSEVDGVFSLMNELFNPENPRYKDDFEDDYRNTYRVINEHKSMFESQLRLANHHNIKTIPSPDSIGVHDCTPYRQSVIEMDDTIPTPDSLFTSSPEDASEFIDRHKKVVYKPVTNGASTKLVSEDTNLDLIENCPAQFQEYVDGTEYKAFILDGEFVTAVQYQDVTTIDYLNSDFDVSKADLNKDIKENCIKAVDKLGFTWSSVDFIIDNNSRQQIIEVNPSASWYTGIGVEEAMVNYFTE